MIKNYEVMFIVVPVGDDEAQKVADKYTTLINNNGGNVRKVDMWGKKRLAFDIRGLSEGIYFLTTFKANPACIKELDRVMRIDEMVMRHMIISKGE